MLYDWKPRVLVHTQPTLTTLNGKHLYVLSLSLIVYCLPYATTWASLLTPYKKLVSESLVFHLADET